MAEGRIVSVAATAAVVVVTCATVLSLGTGHRSDAAPDVAEPTSAAPATSDSATPTVESTPSSTSPTSSRPPKSTPSTSRPATPSPRTSAQPPATHHSPPARTAPRKTTAHRPPVKKPVAPKPVGTKLPLGYTTGSATQVVTVVAHGTTATVQRWNKAAGGGWIKYGAAMFGYVGSAGVTSHAREGLAATPMGSYTLTQAFGRLSKPSTRLPYFRTDAYDWWAGDSSKPKTYNTHQRCAASKCGFSTSQSEQLYYVGQPYNYAVVIDYNRWPAVPGRGSAFFLHVANGQPTGGCVSVSQSNLVAIMSWLNPAKHPRILIGT